MSKTKTVTKTAKKRLTNAEKRVAVAKDVLAQIRAQRYIATSGVYVNVLEPDKVEDSGEERLCDALFGRVAPPKPKARPCEVCGIGSLFVSRACLFDKTVSVDEANQAGYDKKLIDLFGIDQLKLIEEAFEYDYAWENDYPEAEDRLKAIMRNIIRNKGTFKMQQSAEE